MTLWKCKQKAIPFSIGNHWPKKKISWLNSFLLLFFHSFGRTKVYIIKLDTKLSPCCIKFQPPPQKIWSIACLWPCFCMKVLFCTNLKKSYSVSPNWSENWNSLGTVLSYFQIKNRYKQELGMRKTNTASEDSHNEWVWRNLAD